MESKTKILKMIAEDMKNDAKKFDGRPFNGKTVAEYFGNQGAAIASLARIVGSILEADYRCSFCRKVMSENLGCCEDCSS